MTNILANFFRYSFSIIAILIFTQSCYATTNCTIDYVKREIENFDLVTNDNQNSKSHTIERHIAKSDEWLRNYLQSHAKIKGISTYDDLENAKNITRKALIANADKIYNWLCVVNDLAKTDNYDQSVDNQSSSSKYKKYSKKNSQTLRLSYRADDDKIIGHGFLREDSNNTKDVGNIIDVKKQQSKQSQIEQAKYSAYKTNKVVIVLRKKYDQADKSKAVKVTQPKVEDSIGIKRLVDNIFGDKTKPKQESQNDKSNSTKEIDSHAKINSEQQTIDTIQSQQTMVAESKISENNINNPKFFLLTSYPVPN